jgi:glycosyltransferase involved in cell wall biosynthesis
MITTFYPPYNFGGDGIFVQRLSNELARRGHEIEVIHCRDSYRFLAGSNPAGAYDDHPNVTVHGLESGLGFLAPLAAQQTGGPLFERAALRRILDRRFDVIHFHNISLFGPKIFAYGDGVKLYTMHEYWLVCPMHTLYKFNRAPCSEPSCIACTLSYGRPPQWWRYSGLLKNAVRHVDAFIAPSRFIKEKHQEMGLANPIIHLPHFIPDADVTQDSSAENARDAIAEPYFLFAGRLERLKGVHTLIPFFRNYPKARLFIAGTGSYEAELRRLAAGSDKIVFLERCSEEKLRVLYRRAVALIVPSLWFENLPLVIMEAFREKTPVLAHDLGALREVIEASGGGLLYNGEAGLRSAVERLLASPTEREALGARGYAEYRKKWTPDTHFERYFTLIAEHVRAKG